MLTSLLLSAAALAGNPVIRWEAPSRYVDGAPFPVSVSIDIPKDGAPLANWLLTPSAFTLNGKPLGGRKGKEMIPVAAGSEITLSFDLAPSIQAAKGGTKDFELGYAKEYLDSSPIEVTVCTLAPKGLNFMEMPVEDLGKYEVLMKTNQGDMLLEFWPKAAPQHVRNFLDLSYTGFYDGLTFHRVMPGFMIQGGCPDGTGSGQGPRRVPAEFSTDDKYAHVAGVLSMARSGDPNSASAQFFIMHETTPSLDGQYSAFGKLVDGADVVDRIVRSPTAVNGERPLTKQTIYSALVIEAK